MNSGIIQPHGGILINAQVDQERHILLKRMAVETLRYHPERSSDLRSGTNRQRRPLPSPGFHDP